MLPVLFPLQVEMHESHGHIITNESEKKERTFPLNLLQGRMLEEDQYQEYINMLIIIHSFFSGAHWLLDLSGSHVHPYPSIQDVSEYPHPPFCICLHRTLGQRVFNVFFGMFNPLKVLSVSEAVLKQLQQRRSDLILHRSHWGTGCVVSHPHHPTPFSNIVN